MPRSGASSPTRDVMNELDTIADDLGRIGVPFF
jgi:hypothetical protein